MRYLDGMSIDRRLVMPPPPQCYYTLPLEIGVKITSVVNDGIAEFVACAPDRLVALGGVPMDTRQQRNSSERMRQLGFKGAEVLTKIGGRELSGEAFAPFWAKAEGLGAPVVIHPNGFTEAKRLSRLYFNNIVRNPLETALALQYLIFNGVLQRHPT